MIVLEIILLYIIFVWFVLRLIVPHLGFFKRAIPEKIPGELEIKIEELNRSSKSNEEFLKGVYNFVVNKYYGSRSKTITNFWRAYGDVYEKSPGFLPCTGQNYLLRTILVKSGRFSEGDIKVVTVPLNFFIHQYLKVKIGEAQIDVDPWSHFLGVPLGKKSAFVG